MTKTDGETVYPYVIIGGAPKAGTTSLFRYLSAHPAVCPANRKETYFFARKFDLNGVCTCGDTLADFEKYFSHCCSSTRLRLEGTPYTLYAKDAASKIGAILPDPLVLFILRDPVMRLISDYRFHLHRDHPSTRGSLEDFIEWQSFMRGDVPGLLDFGCYIKYLRSFFSILGHRRVHILIFKEFFKNPRGEIQNLCKSLGIDGSFYRSYIFETHNPTINHRFSWLNKLYVNLEPLVAELRTRVIKSQRLHKVFENIIKRGKYTYRKLNSGNMKQENVFPAKMVNYLRDYYKPYNDALSEELQRPLPW